jgi:hypothetical protein
VEELAFLMGKVLLDEQQLELLGKEALHKQLFYLGKLRQLFLLMIHVTFIFFLNSIVMLFWAYVSAYI